MYTLYTPSINASLNTFISSLVVKARGYKIPHSGGEIMTKSKLKADISRRTTFKRVLVKKEFRK